jgi:hypothetical protein
VEEMLYKIAETTLDLRKIISIYLTAAEREEIFFRDGRVQNFSDR